MKQRLLLASVFVIGLFAATPGRADTGVDNTPKGFDPATYPLSREIGKIESGSGLYRITGDAGVYLHAGPDFRSLRLAKESDGVWIELPWVSRRVLGPSKMGPLVWGHRIESLDETPDGVLEIVVSFSGSGGAPARLEIDTPLTDFEKGVSIAIPGPEGSWTEIVKDGVIFDHRRFLDFRHTSVDVPATDSRRIRIRISEATDVQRSRLREITRTVGEASGLAVTESVGVETRAFRIDGLRFVLVPNPTEDESVIMAHSRQIHPIVITRQTTLPDGTTEVILDGGFLPLDRLVLETGDRNFRRPVSVQVPGANENWQTIYRTHLHRYEVGDFRDESLAITLPETRAEQLRLLVENGANAPVTFSSITGQGPSYEFFFLAGPGDHPVLFFGGRDTSLTKPPLDTAAIEAAIRRGVAAAPITPGDVLPNPAYRVDAAKPAGSGLLDSKPALWSIITLVVGVLIWVLYRALRQIEGVSVGDE